MIVLCWNEKQFSGIHDHSSSHCFVKVLKGKIRETLYNNPNLEDNKSQNHSLNVKQETEYTKNKVAYIHGDFIFNLQLDNIGLHKMGNPSPTEKSVTMHIYILPYKKCHIFNEKNSCCEEYK
ncbi:hypothetical protein HZS_6582, partial [Henneguya salminicola]